MLPNQNVEVKIASRNHKHFKELGYEVYNGKILTVKAEELTKGSNIEVQVICDYCGKLFYKKYVSYLKANLKNNLQKDACQDCRILKSQEVIELKYNNKSAWANKEVREKIKKTCKEKYGFENPAQAELIKEKIKNTNLERYGAENVFQVESIKNRQRETVLEKYGVTNVFMSEKIKEKIKNTNLKKYGVPNPMQHPKIKNKSIKKSRITKYKNNSQTASKNQRHIHDLVGGELNYVFDRLWLDIGFPEQKIYIEYDGSGHDLSVKYKKMTKKEFYNKEIKRYKFLKSRGWKEIRIISLRDSLPSDEKLLSYINHALSVLKSESSFWVKIDLDKNVLTTKEKTISLW